MAKLAVIYHSQYGHTKLQAEAVVRGVASVAKWFTMSWRDKIAGAFTNSSSYSGDKLNTLQGIVVFAMQHGMIFVGTGMMPAESDVDSMNTTEGPGPNVTNRMGSFIGPMAASFQVDPPPKLPRRVTSKPQRFMGSVWLRRPWSSWRAGAD